MGKNPGTVQNRSNIQPSEDIENEEYLFANVRTEIEVQSKTECQNDNVLSKVSSSSLSTSSLSDYSSVLETSNEKDGFQYLCGWVAKKFKDNYLFYVITPKTLNQIIRILNQQTEFSTCHLWVNVTKY